MNECGRLKSLSRLEVGGLDQIGGKENSGGWVLCLPTTGLAALTLGVNTAQKLV